MKALVIGATGATGKELVAQLLEDEAFTEVHIFVRRAYNCQNPKLYTHIIDFEKPQTWAALLHGDVAFSCLGTTLAQAGNKQAQWRVDYDYQLHFAENCSKNHVKTFVLVSAARADAKSAIYYSKMKGMLEDVVKKLPFDRLFILQPSILERNDSSRLGEKFSLKAIKLFNKIGMFRKYRPISTAVLAQKMIKLAKTEQKGIKIIALEQILKV